jgi:hypothetical protein
MRRGPTLHHARQQGVAGTDGAGRRIAAGGHARPGRLAPPAHLRPPATAPPGYHGARRFPWRHANRKIAQRRSTNAWNSAWLGLIKAGRPVSGLGAGPTLQSTPPARRRAGQLQQFGIKTGRDAVGSCLKGYKFGFCHQPTKSAFNSPIWGGTGYRFPPIRQRLLDRGGAVRDSKSHQQNSRDALRRQPAITAAPPAQARRLKFSISDNIAAHRAHCWSGCVVRPRRPGFYRLQR